MKKTLIIATVCFILGLSLAGFIFVYHPEKDKAEAPPDDPSSEVFSPYLYAKSPAQVRTDLNFVTIAEQVGPAVLNIEAEKVERVKYRSLLDDSPFEDFWRWFGPPQQREREQRSASFGTGFVISSDGYIVTNNHIVENAIKVTVTSVEGKEYKAEIKGTDPDTDLALLKIDAKDLPFVELGDSSVLKPGEWVMAIGNPFKLQHTVTAGIVSAKGRVLGVNLRYQDFIQTDAAINPGNSGGPLVDMKGKVVGINSVIQTTSGAGGNIGIGFAIPSNLAKKVIKQLREKGRVVRGYLGVISGAINEDEMKLLNLESRMGALVESIESGTPADESDLKRYDVITKIDSQPIKDDNDLKFKVAEIPPGTTVELTVIRDGKEKIIKVKIAELQTESARETKPTSEKDLGIRVDTLTPNIARYYNLRTQKGVLVTEVIRLSQAEKQGIQRGDIIIEANRKPVESLDDLNKIIKKLDTGDPLMLLLVRESQGIEYIATLRIPE